MLFYGNLGTWYQAVGMVDHTVPRSGHRQVKIVEDAAGVSHHAGPLHPDQRDSQVREVASARFVNLDDVILLLLYPKLKGFVPDLDLNV